MRFAVCIAILFACHLSAAPRLKTPSADEKTIVIGFHFFTIGGDELEIIRIDRNDLYQVREVRSGISTLDARTYGREPYKRSEILWILENVNQKSWDDDR